MESELIVHALANYRDVMAGTVAQLTDVLDRLPAPRDRGEADAMLEMRAGARVMDLLVGDVTKILEGRDLKRWGITGVVPPQ